MKKILSFLLVVALVFQATVISNTDVFAAKNKKVKSVKTTNLKGKKLTLQIGKKKTLKVKVKATNKKYTKFTVKSSKKTVVAVKKSGKKVILTAKKAGTSKVTIAAKSNKKKKKVITVTVPKPAQIVPGTPVTPVIVPDTPVAARDYIMGETIVPLEKGKLMSDLFVPFKLENDFVITNVSGLPKGLLAEKIGNKYQINGIPSEIGVFHFSVTAKDKVNGEKNTSNVTFVIGSESKIQVYCPTISGFYYNDGATTFYENVVEDMYVVGGSGTYKVSTVGGNSSMFSFDEAEDHDFYTTYPVIVNYSSVGKFATTAKVIDVTTADLGTTDLNLAISEGERITGRITDMQGQGVKDLTVQARSTTYYDTVFSEKTDANGYYTLYVSKDSYSVTVQNHDIVLAETEAVAINKNTTLNYKIQGYTVNLVSSNSHINLEDAVWYSDSSKTKVYGEGTKLFVASGSYSIYADFFDPEVDINQNYVATASFSVSANRSVTVNVVAQSLPTNVGVIGVGTNTLSNIVSTNLVFYRFTPSQSGQYMIRSNSPQGKDVDAYLYDNEGTFIKWNADSNNIDGNGIDFKIRNDFTAGKTYYIAMWDLNENSEETEVIIEKIEQE